MIATQPTASHLLSYVHRPSGRLDSNTVLRRKSLYTCGAKLADMSTVNIPAERISRRQSTPPAYTNSAIEDHLSSDDATPANSIHSIHGSRSSSHGSSDTPHTEHVVHLSSIEDCMPRAYIRICLAYTVSSDHHLSKALAGLQAFVKGIVQAKPYLAGNVIDVESPGEHAPRAEIRFTTNEYLNYPAVEVNRLYDEAGNPIKYDELKAAGLPPSRLLPEVVSALPPNSDSKTKSPVLRVRANIVEGGIIVSIYLHHCVSDGKGFDLITSGDLCKDGFTFKWPAEEGNKGLTGLDADLEIWAQKKSDLRLELSRAPTNTMNSRGLVARHLDQPARPTNPPGRGCVLFINGQMIRDLVQRYNKLPEYQKPDHHSVNSLLMALLWRHMIKARRPSIQHNEHVTTSRLMIPVDLRRKVKKALPASYFGAAVDFGMAELPLDTLTELSLTDLPCISHSIRQAVQAVDDDHIRQVIAFANRADSNTDVQDLQASNMDRVNGADMYITSWLKLRSYQHDLGMGLGGPDWVRKPWSRDPGSCIILPQKKTDPDFYEVVVQSTEADMTRLLDDRVFMQYILKIVD